MHTKLQKWGNSQGVRVSKTILEKSQISIGESVAMSAKKGLITIKPVPRPRGKHNLKDLVAQVPKDYKPQESDWGEPVGKEEW